MWHLFYTFSTLGFWLDSELTGGPLSLFCSLILTLGAMAWVWPSMQCSTTCGEGIQQRQVGCRTNANSLGQCEGDKPDTVQVCSLPACGGKHMGWGGLAPFPKP
jgi:hypothetical protein